MARDRKFVVKATSERWEAGEKFDEEGAFETCRYHDEDSGFVIGQFPLFVQQHVQPGNAQYLRKQPFRVQPGIGDFRKTSLRRFEGFQYGDPILFFLVSWRSAGFFHHCFLLERCFLLSIDTVFDCFVVFPLKPNRERRLSFSSGSFR